MSVECREECFGARKGTRDSSPGRKGESRKKEEPLKGSYSLGSWGRWGPGE